MTTRFAKEISKMVRNMENVPLNQNLAQFWLLNLTKILPTMEQFSFKTNLDTQDS